jgi:hypothetical protein
MSSKVVVLFSLLCACTFVATAKSLPLSPFKAGAVTDSSSSETAPIVKPARDFVMIQIGSNSWMNRPDSVKTTNKGYVFNAYICYDFPIKKSKMSFAAGLGIHTSTIYLDNMELVRQDTGALGGAARFIKETENYKRYKVNDVYLQAPFELRYFGNTLNRNKGFKAALGVQVGTLLGGHTKGITSINSNTIKEKVNTKRYLSPWNFAATARVGMGNFTLFGSYNITKVFKESGGPDITPFSVGLCLTGL